jgi:hypothetical protein
LRIIFRRSTPVYPPLPAVLPNRLTAYLPDRLHVVPSEEWPHALMGRFERTGVRTTIPRYALDLRTQKDDIDPDRVRWLAQGSTIRTLATRHVHLTAHKGVLWIVDGHTALAAHLAAGSDDIPVRLVAKVAADAADAPDLPGPARPASSRRAAVVTHASTPALAG